MVALINDGPCKHPLLASLSGSRFTLYQKEQLFQCKLFCSNFSSYMGTLSQVQQFQLSFLFHWCICLFFMQCMSSPEWLDHVVVIWRYCFTVKQLKRWVAWSPKSPNNIYHQEEREGKLKKTVSATLTSELQNVAQLQFCLLKQESEWIGEKGGNMSQWWSMSFW